MIGILPAITQQKRSSTFEMLVWKSVADRNPALQRNMLQIFNPNCIFHPQLHQNIYQSRIFFLFFVCVYRREQSRSFLERAMLEFLLMYYVRKHKTPLFYWEDIVKFGTEIQFLSNAIVQHSTLTVKSLHNLC
jgi:hypothetical protein